VVEKRAYRFIYENSNVYKVRVFLFSLLVFAGLIALFIAFRGFLWGAIRENGIVQSIINLIHLEFTELNPGELFFTGLLGGLFFVHMNQEYVLLGGLIWKLLGKKLVLWRHRTQTKPHFPIRA
jgi:hypothetical protein